MLPKRHTAVRLAFKSFSSTLSVNYSAQDASYNYRVIEQAHSQGRGNAIDLKRTVADAFQDKSKGLICATNIRQAESSSSDTTQDMNRLRSLLNTKDYIKFMIELTIQSKLNSNFSRKIFEDNLLTPNEFSTLLNGLLTERNLSTKLETVLPSVQSTEMIFGLYQTYLMTIPAGSLNPLQLHDLNSFVQYFIETAQLGKAQIVLDRILASNNDQLPCDTTTGIHYLQLRCGALPRNWKVFDSRVGHSCRLGSHRNKSQPVSHTYKALDQSSVLEFVNVLNDENSEWFHKKSPTLEAAVIYSLGFMGQLTLLKEHIAVRWGITELGASLATKMNEVPPSPEVLIAIFTSFASHQEVTLGLRLMDAFITKYSEINLDILFWRRLFQWTNLVWDVKTDPRGDLSRGCWRVMTEWHEKGGKKLQPDTTLLNERYFVLAQTNNYKEALTVISQSFPQLYEKPTLSSKEMAIVQKYSKLVLKSMAELGYYHKPLTFIKEWSPNKAVEDSLRVYFKKHRDGFTKRKERLREESRRKQNTYDDEEEDNMLLGRLW